MIAIGDLITVGKVTGKIIRMKDENTVTLFDGQENHDVKIEQDLKPCTGCRQTKPLNHFRMFKSGRISHRCDTCRAKDRDAGLDDMNFRDILEEKADLHERKNTDYGNSFDELMDEFGIKVLLIHLTEKLNRIKQLAGNEALIKTESIEDSLIDLSNYADMGLLWIRKEQNK